MKPSGSNPRRVGMLVVAGVVVGLVGLLVAMSKYGGSRPEDAVPDRQASNLQAPSPTHRATAPRPELPPAPANAPPAEGGATRAETKIVLTEIKVQKYVDEAYPAWLQAHPGQACPRRLIELNEYMEDKDANDAWGRPLRMVCARQPGANRIKVVSLGRDGEARSEDDIQYGE